VIAAAGPVPAKATKMAAISLVLLIVLVLH
jgi:hypothetical protein